MPRVTVGVPVYNGASLIGEALACIATQSFDDMEVIISDNGSTDGTSDICAAFADRDRRFRHVRHPETMDVMSNFMFARDQAQSPLFLWRAYDDLSSVNYIEALVEVFDRAPQTLLAVGAVSHETGGARADRRTRYQADDSGPRLRRILSQLFRGHASWYYGMWNRAACVEITDTVASTYADPWAGDHLTLFHCALRDGIRGTNAATFRQRVLDDLRDYVPRPKMPYHEMTDRKARFGAQCRAALDAADLNAREKAVLGALLPFYVNRRCHGVKRLLQARFRRER